MTTYLSSLNVNYKREFRRNVKQASERASIDVWSPIINWYKKVINAYEQHGFNVVGYVLCYV